MGFFFGNCCLLVEGSGATLCFWWLIRLISTHLHSPHIPATPIHVTDSISIIWFCFFKNFPYLCITKFRKTVKFFAISCSREVAASFLTRGIRIHSTTDRNGSLHREAIFRIFTPCHGKRPQPSLLLKHEKCMGTSMITQRQSIVVLILRSASSVLNMASFGRLLIII